MLIIIVGLIAQIDFSDLSFETNKSYYIAIISGVCGILALYLSNKYEKRKLV